MNYSIPNFSVIGPTTTVCVCDILGCFFQRGKSECQPSSWQYRAEWIKKGLCLWKYLSSTCHLSQSWEELAHPFSLGINRDLPAFSALSPLLQAPTVTASSYIAPLSWVFPSLQPGSDLNLYHFPRHLSTDHFPQSCCLELLSLLELWPEALEDDREHWWYRKICSCCHFWPPGPRRQTWLLTRFCSTLQALILHTLQTEKAFRKESQNLQLSI